MTKHRTSRVVLGLALICLPCLGCKTAGLANLPGMSWIERDKPETLLAANEKASVELPPPSSVAVPAAPTNKSAVPPRANTPAAGRLARSTPANNPNYPSTPYPEFRNPPNADAVAQSSYETGTYETTTQTPPQKAHNLSNTSPPGASQPQRGFYGGDYDPTLSSRRTERRNSWDHPVTDDASGGQASTRASAFPQGPVSANGVGSGNASPQGANQPATAASSTWQTEATPSSPAGNGEFIPDQAPHGQTSNEGAGANPSLATQASHGEAIDGQAASTAAPSVYQSPSTQELRPWRPGSTSDLGVQTTGLNAPPAALNTSAPSHAPSATQQPPAGRGNSDQPAPQTNGRQSQWPGTAW